jgi:hypothetical protein
MLQSKAFVKSTRRAARARLKASAVWWRQYKKAKGGWKYYLLICVGVFFLSILVPFLLIGIPILAGIGIAQSSPTEMRVGMALSATIIAAIMVGHGAFLMRELLVSRTLAVVSQLPIDDKDVLKNRSWLVFRIALFALVISISFFGAFAIAADGTIQQRLTIGLMGIAEWLVVLAFSFVIPAYFPKLARQDSVGALIGMAFLLWMFGGIAAAMQVVQPENIALIALIALPTGWPFLLIEFAVFDGQVAGFLMLIPIVLSVIAMAFSFRRMQNRYIVREITINDNALATAVLAPEFLMQAKYTEWLEEHGSDEGFGDEHENFIVQDPDDSSPIFKSIVDWVAVIPQSMQDVELTPQEARDSVRSREFLEPMDWSSMGWIESRVGNTLRDSEKMTAELMAGGTEPSWTKRQAADLIILTVVILVMLGIQEIWGFRILATVGHLAFFAFFAMLRGSWPGAIWRASTGHVTTVMGILPIHQKEMNRAVMVLAVARCILFLPFAMGLAFVVVYGFTGKIDVELSLHAGAKATLLLAAIHQWWFLSLQPTALTQPIRSIICDSIVALVLIILTLAGGGGLVFAGSSEGWSAVAALFLFGPGWLAHKWQHHRVLTGATDFVTTRVNQREAQRRQQEIVNRNW